MTTPTAVRPAMPMVAEVEHTFLDLGDGRMHVATLGSGDPVLMLAGFGQTWWEWRDLTTA